ncbi:phosphotransferase-like protein [Propionibacteriaceae bacterium Y1685]
MLLNVPAVLVEADQAFPTFGSTAGREPAVLAFHQACASWIDLGYVLILDGSLPYGNNDLRDRCLEVFPPESLRIIAVTADVQTLRRREQQRAEVRDPGWAEKQAADIHDGITAAMHLDTSNLDPEGAARAIYSRLVESANN